MEYTAMWEHRFTAYHVVVLSELDYDNKVCQKLRG
jgi:hypothetical protein